jgi:glycosyltransferase involved in cell wall biosynthesis
MSRTRITLVTHYFSTHRGGVEQAAGQLAERMAQTGNFNIEWFASGCDPAPAARRGVSHRPLPAWNRLEAWGVPWPVWSWRSLALLKRSIQSCDAVHLHDFIYLGSIAAFIWARRLGKPVVITQHVGDATYRNRVQAWVLRTINRTLGRYILARASQVVFISVEVRRQFESHTRFPKAPLYWPNALDTTVFHPSDHPARQALRAQLAVQDKPVLLFVGRFTPMKGIDLLKDIASGFPQAQWWFAGWGQERSLWHPSHWGQPQVRVFDDRSGSALADLYRAADLLLLPSYSEGFPLVVQEAMACGTPVLASPEAVMGAPDAGAWIHTCSLRPYHSAAKRWKAAIAEIIENPSLPERRAPLAAFARTEWTWERCVERYAQLFASLTHPATRSPAPAPPDYT